MPAHLTLTNRTYLALIVGAALVAGMLVILSFNTSGKSAIMDEPLDPNIATKTVLLAAGCFWSVEFDLEKVAGVLRVVSGYAGGTSENPTYSTYVAGGHREVVEVTYDPTRVSYSNLVEYIIKHSDPTDADGSFYDRGGEYAPAIYYETEEEKKEAESVIAALDAMKVYPKPIATVVIPREDFWPAEEYHQNYAQKNPGHYAAYRAGSGRAAFIEKYWADNANEFILREPSSNL